ncbi:hypothetical protein TEA_004286 [Camellia sinensis var. sinensis]|uniref:Mediator of RNA polymerase II transcription subunit 9 n=1 Tax=Camellia sinensis var. sinensis TaxID=542762 RepID=A0A4S4E5S5_CAMSN|nr:hypothetical protein TEA_004286 [Camellia sinensis var. sinensis]
MTGGQSAGCLASHLAYQITLHSKLVKDAQFFTLVKHLLFSQFDKGLLVENLADAIENGTRDQNSDALVTDLNNHFEKCQQLLNSISGSINAKTMTVEGQKLKFEESEQLLNQRKDLIAKYRNSVEELIKAEP